MGFVDSGRMADGEQLSRAGLLERLVRLVESTDRDHPARVAIDGPDAAGKTTIADELAVVLRAGGREVIRASIDGFHRPRAQRYARGPDSAVGYYLDSFDYDALRSSLLDPLGPGGSREYRAAVFDFRDDGPTSERTKLAPAWSVLVFDGVFLFRPELRDCWDVRIFVSASFGVTLRRALRRDRALFGSAEEVERRYRVRYIPGQELYFSEARPEDTADAVIVNDDPAAPVLQMR
jgi:uridine kinase